MVFFFSAVMHEVLISVPFHMIRPWAFWGMMGQIPLVILTKYVDKRRPGSSFGNISFWVSFCFVGQPMACLMYTIDYWKQQSVTTTTLLQEDIITHMINTTAAKIMSTEL